MYGTLGRIKIKPGHENDVLALMDEWERERAPIVEGDLGGYLYKLDADANTFYLVAAFADKKSYVANADDPEQDKWFRRLAEHFDGEPEWNDGEIVRAWKR